MDPSVSRLAAKYGADDLGSNAAFAGGFINFGYWREIPLAGELSYAQRVRSQEDLYRLVLDALRVGGSRLLEVGCGRGKGCALALAEYAPHEVSGIDLHQAQVDRAVRDNADLLEREPDRLSYRQGSAGAIPFPDGAFDRVISVEVAQHIDDLASFVQEVKRVLAPSGRFALATFFMTADEHREELTAMLLPLADGTDRANSIGALDHTLRQAGFTSISIERIGDHVWPGWDKWLAQTEHRDRWPRNFLVAYRRGLLDYYLVTAETPG